MKKIILKIENVIKKGPAPHRRRKPSGSGFVILFAVTLTAILLSIALGVASIAEKEVKFRTSARETGNAIYAADTGIECALVYDRSDSAQNAFTTGSTVSMNCAGSAIDVAQTGSLWTFVVPGLGSSAQSCAKVSVEKDSDTDPRYIQTTIVSKGYNLGDADCESTDASRVERELEVRYQVGNPTPPPPEP